MIPYMVGKLAPNSSYLTRGLFKYDPGRGYFRAVPSQNGDKYVTSPPPHSLNLSTGLRGLPASPMAPLGGAKVHGVGVAMDLRAYLHVFTARPHWLLRMFEDTTSRNSPT